MPNTASACAIAPVASVSLSATTTETFGCAAARRFAHSRVMRVCGERARVAITRRDARVQLVAVDVARQRLEAAAVAEAELAVCVVAEAVELALLR